MHHAKWQFRVIGVLAGAAAAAVGWFGVYRGLVVPRLDGWTRVPLQWWVLVAAPLALVSGSLAVWQPRRWLAAALFPAIGLELVVVANAASALIRGAPLAHDTFSPDGPYVLALGVQFVVIFCALVVLAGCAALAARGRRAA